MITADDIYQYALDAGAKHPQLVVSQWILESGGGKHLAARNNPYGLKGSGSLVNTVEYINGKPITIRDSFLEFGSQKEATEYLVKRWYLDYRGHTGVNNAATAKDAAYMLVSEGYATDPAYGDKLIRIMSTVKAPSQYADLVDAAEFYDGLPHQKQAYRELQATLSASQRELFTRAWRSGPVTPSKPKFPLAVPYFGQLDSKTGQGERMCQSSAIAMRIEQIDSNIIGDDDSYLNIVNRYGDTVSQSAHQKALNHLGLKAVFRQSGTEKILCDLLDQGIAVPIGILHKGPISNPTGGGHWVTLIGYDDKYFHVHDPFSELDLVNGGYPNPTATSGKNVRYTRKNLMKRWLIDSSGADGWLWEIRR